MSLPPSKRSRLSDPSVVNSTCIDGSDLDQDTEVIASYIYLFTGQKSEYRRYSVLPLSGIPWDTQFDARPGAPSQDMLRHALMLLDHYPALRYALRRNLIHYTLPTCGVTLIPLDCHSAAWDRDSSDFAILR